jgi:hypothetical protein
MTAVEWLYEQISVCTDFTKEELLEQAKEMEKQQLYDEYQKGGHDAMSNYMHWEKI